MHSQFKENHVAVSCLINQLKSVRTNQCRSIRASLSLHPADPMLQLVRNGHCKWKWWPFLSQVCPGWYDCVVKPWPCLASRIPQAVEANLGQDAKVAQENWRSHPSPLEQGGEMVRTYGNMRQTLWSFWSRGTCNELLIHSPDPFQIHRLFPSVQDGYHLSNSGEVLLEGVLKIITTSSRTINNNSELVVDEKTHVKKNWTKVLSTADIRFKHLQCVAQLLHGVSPSPWHEVSLFAPMSLRNPIHQGTS